MKKAIALMILICLAPTVCLATGNPIDGAPIGAKIILYPIIAICYVFYFLPMHAWEHITGWFESDFQTDNNSKRVSEL